MHQSPSIAPAAVTDAPSARRDRPAEFAAALTVRLANLPDDTSRRKELIRLLGAWTVRYERFANEVDAGTWVEVPGGPDVHDFLETIAVIEQRLRPLAVTA